MGLVGKTVFQKTDESWISYQFPGTIYRSIGGITSTEDGTIWAGNGCMLNNQMYQFANSPLTDIFTIEASPDGTIWYGTPDGIYVFTRAG